MWSDSLSAAELDRSTILQPVLSVVVPTRNEATTIGPFLQRLLLALESIESEVIVVDDSDDETVGVLRELGSNLGDRMLVRHRAEGSVPQRTLGTAVVDGIRLARGEFVCVMDADGQHPPEVIPRLLAHARQTGAEYVGGSRYVPGGSAEGLNGRTRKVVSRVLGLVARAAFLRTPVRTLTDPLSGFFLFRRDIVQTVALQPIGWKISLEVLIRARVRNAAEVPYVFASRADDVSKANLRQGLLFLKHLLVLLWSLTAIRRFVSFGLVGLSGMIVNTGLLLALAALGLNALAWPIWVATECAILWNYAWNSRITWGDRPRRHLWRYQAAAWCSSLMSIRLTTLLVSLAVVPLWLGSISGIAAGMLVNYLIFETFVFPNVSSVFGRRVPSAMGTRENQPETLIAALYRWTSTAGNRLLPVTRGGPAGERAQSSHVPASPSLFTT
jgi:dolichol-phosphate mannosyltransferase